MTTENLGTENQDQNPLESSDIMSFDLGEAGGGEQMIFAQKKIDEKSYYVFTLGNAPRHMQNQEAEKANNQVADKLKGILGKLPGLNKKTNQAEQNGQQPNIKLRCFKLTHMSAYEAQGEKPQAKNNEFMIEEYVTPKGVADVARFFGADKAPEPTL